MGNGLLDRLKKKVDVTSTDETVTESASGLKERLLQKSGIATESIAPESPLLSAATDVMKNTLKSVQEKPEPNLVQFKGETAPGQETTRTYTNIPGKGIDFSSTTQETTSITPQPVDAKKPLTFNPKAGESFQAAMQQQDAQREIAGHLSTINTDVQKDAENIIKSAPDIIQVQLGKMGIDNGFIQRLGNPDGDVDAVGTYAKAKKALIENENKQKLLALNNEHPVSQQMPRSAFNEGLPEMTRQDEEAYNQKLSKVNEETTQQLDKLNSDVFNLSAIKSFNEDVKAGTPISEISPLQMGMKIRSAMGERLEAGLVDGKDLDPSTKVATELMGYRAMKVAQADAFAKGDLQTAQELENKTAGFTKKVLDDNPEFKRKQIETALANEIYENDNSILSAIKGKNVTEEDVKMAQQKLGISDEDMAGISPENIKRWSGVAQSTVNSFIRTGIAPAVEFLDRHVANTLDKMMGGGLTERQLNEKFDSNWYDNSAVGRFFGGASPDAMEMVKSGTKVDTNPLSDSYLMNISDSNDSRWNVSPMSIVNTITNGTGQMLGIATGANELGAAIKTAGIVSDFDKARRLGMNVYMGITNWDNSYKQARNAIGDNPEDEYKRMGLAMVYNAAEVASENIIPDYKITDQIFQTKALRSLLGNIEKNGLEGVSKATVQDAFKEGAIEWAKNTGGEGLEEVAATYGQAVGDMMFAPDKFKQENYNQLAVESGVIGAVSAILPTGVGALRQSAQAGPMAKALMYEVGGNPEYYKAKINELIDNNTISQQDGNNKIQVINTLNTIVDGTVPQISPVNNKELTVKQKQDFANNVLQERLLQKNIETAKDEVQTQINEEKIAKLKEERRAILENAGEQVISEPININNNEKVSKSDGVQEVGNAGEGSVQESGTIQEDGQQENVLNENALKKTEGNGPTKPEVTVPSVNFDFTDEDNSDNNINITQDATQVSQEQNQAGDQQSSVSQYQGVDQGQQEVRQGEGEQRNAAQPSADNSNSGIGSAEGQAKEEISPFAESKQKDVFYHGSPHGKFDEFDIEKRGTSADLTGYGDWGNGFYFSPSKETAVRYANNDKQVSEPNPHVFSVYLDMKNPLDLSKQSGVLNSLLNIAKKKGVGLTGLTDQDYELAFKENNTTEKEYEFSKEILSDVEDNFGDWDIGKKIKEEGYDSIISPNDERVVFDKKQIHIINDKKNYSRIPTPVKGINNYITKSGNQKVVFSRGGIKVLDSKTGKEVSKPTQKKAIIEAAKSYDFTKGETQGDKPMEGIKDMDMHVAENSQNPAELAALYVGQEPQGQSLNGPEFAIAEFGGFQTTNDSYNRFGDRNNKTRSIGLNYLNNEKGTSLDEVAREITDHIGIEVTPQDLVDFIDRFPGGVQQALRTEPNAVAVKAAEQFEKITGFPLTPEISDEALAQQMKFNTEKENELLNKDYESIEQFEADFWDAIAKGEITYEGEASGASAPTQSGEIGIQANTAVPKTAVNTTEERMQSLLETIDDLRRKESISNDAKEQLRKSGKEHTVDYQVKFKAWQQVHKKLGEAQRAYNLLHGKAMAEALRKYKVPKSDLTLTSPVQIPVALYNAAIETAALALEGGAHIKNAVQQAVDFVNEKWLTNWDEQKFRKEILNEDIAFPKTAEELRLLKENETQISDKNKEVADGIIQAISDNRLTMEEAIDNINGLDKIGPDTKKKIIKYLRGAVNETIYKKGGLQSAQQYISDNANDYDAALRQLQQDTEVQLLNAQTEAERENINQKAIAAKAYIQAEKTKAQVANGELTPVNPFVKSENTKSKWNLPEQGFIDKKTQQVANKYSRLEQAQKESGAANTEAYDAVSGLRLAKGRAWDIIHQVSDYLGDLKETKGSLFDRLSKAGISLNEFGLYLFAKHAEERNRENAKLRQEVFDSKVVDLNQQIANAKGLSVQTKLQEQLDNILAQKDPNYILMPDGGSGMTNAQAQEILAEVEKDGKTEDMEKFAKEFRENVVNKILDYKYEAGLVSDEEYNHIRSAYENYVPLKFDIEEQYGEGNKKFEDIKASGRELYRSTGAKDVTYDKRNNVVTQAIVDLEKGILKSEVNKANLRLAKLVEDFPNENVWEVRPAKYEVTTNAKGEIVYGEEINKPKDAVQYWQEGKKKYVVFHDPALKETFKKVDDPSLLMQVGRAATNITRLFATMTNPEFIALNPAIDLQDATAFVAGQDNPELAKEWAKNLPNIFKAQKALITGKGEWADKAKEWKAGGGAMNFTKELSIDKRADKALKNFNNYNKRLSVGDLKKIGSSIENFTSALENGTRLLVYDTAIKAGMSKEKALILSREATIDFEKSGLWGQKINAWKAFSNAGIQGTSSILTLAKSKYFRNIVGMSLLAGITEAFMADMLGDCEDQNPADCYWEMDEFKKQKSFIIPTSDGYVTLPIGRRLGWFNYMGQQIYSMGKWMSTDGEQGTDPADFFVNTFTSALDYYNPTGSVNVGDNIATSAGKLVAGNFAPVIGEIGNENAFGQQITPTNKEEVPDHLNYFPNAPKAYQSAANWLSSISGGGGQQEGAIEVSPNTLQFIMQSTFSGAYNFAEKTAKEISDIAEGDFRVKDAPILRRVMSRESNMTPTKNKKNDIVEKSKNNELTEEDKTNLNKYLDHLIEGGQLPVRQGETPEDAKGRVLDYVERNQRKYEKRVEKAQENEDNSE